MPLPSSKQSSKRELRCGSCPCSCCAALYTLTPRYRLQIPDADALITTVKTCLRTPNQHLTTATLSALPPLLPLLVTRPGLARSSSASPVSPTASTSSTAPSFVDAHALRQVLQAFLPPGGVVDRLGDSRERAREKAREILVVLGGFAFRCGGASVIMGRSREGKGPETPLMIFEKHLRENGLASKVWRVREQVCCVYN